VSNVKRTGDRALRDHAALKIELKFHNINWLVPKIERRKVVRKVLKINKRILRASARQAFKSKIV